MWISAALNHKNKDLMLGFDRFDKIKTWDIWVSSFDSVKQDLNRHTLIWIFYLDSRTQTQLLKGRCQMPCHFNDRPDRLGHGLTLEDMRLVFSRHEISLRQTKLKTSSGMKSHQHLLCDSQQWNTASFLYQRGSFLSVSSVLSDQDIGGVFHYLLCPSLSWGSGSIWSVVACYQGVR